jgi:hypothetical protein
VGVTEGSVVAVIVGIGVEAIRSIGELVKVGVGLVGGMIALFSVPDRIGVAVALESGVVTEPQAASRNARKITHKTG